MNNLTPYLENEIYSPAKSTYYMYLSPVQLPSQALSPQLAVSNPKSSSSTSPSSTIIQTWRDSTISRTRTSLGMYSVVGDHLMMYLRTFLNLIIAPTEGLVQADHLSFLRHRYLAHKTSGYLVGHRDIIDKSKPSRRRRRT